MNLPFLDPCPILPIQPAPCSHHYPVKPSILVPQAVPAQVAGGGGGTVRDVCTVCLLGLFHRPTHLFYRAVHAFQAAK